MAQSENITDPMEMNFSKLGEVVEDKEAWRAAISLYNTFIYVLYIQCGMTILYIVYTIQYLYIVYLLYICYIFVYCCTFSLLYFLDARSK